MPFHRRQAFIIDGIERVLYGIDAELHRHLVEGGQLDWLGIDGLSDQLVLALGGREQKDRIHAAQPLVERIFEAWPVLGAYPFGETLAEFEFEGAFYKGHRDHVVHQLRVFLLGLWLWDHCPAIKAAMAASPEWGATDEDTFRHRWTITALFHDVGYVFEAQDPGAVHLLHPVAAELDSRLQYPLSGLLERQPRYASLRAVEQELAEDLGLPRAPAVRSVTGLSRPRRGTTPLVALEPAAVLAGLAGCPEPLDAYLRMAKDKPSTRSPGRPRFYDHGVVGAMLLVRLFEHWRGTLEALHGQDALARVPGLAEDVARLWGQVEPAGDDLRAAAAAIALHNVAELWKPGEARGEVGLLLDDLTISLDTLPLPFLLRLCDGLQEWDRPRRCLWDQNLPPILTGQELCARAEGGRLVLAFPRDPARYPALLGELDRGLAKEDVRALLACDLAVPVPSSEPPPPPSEGPKAQAFERALLDWTVREFAPAALMGLMHDRVADLALEEVYVPVCVKAPWLGRDGERWDLLERGGADDLAPSGKHGRRTVPHGELVRTSIFEATLVPELAALIPDDAVPFELLVGVAGLERLALLGEPGAGKTTVLRILALRLAQALRGEDPCAEGIFQPSALGPRAAWPVPLFLPLRELVPWMESRRLKPGALTPGRLRDWIRAQCRERCAVAMPVGYLNAALEQGRLWLMFDALDEVPDEVTRLAMARAIKGLAEQFTRCRMALTARTREYSGAAVLALEPELPTVEIAPLSRPLAERFCHRWSAARWRGDGEGEGTPPDGYVAGLLRAVHDPRLADDRLVGNPLLLTAVAVVFDDERRLPDSRAELYERCCRVLLRLRDWSEQPVGAVRLFEREPGREVKLGLLMAVAQAMHAQQDERFDQGALLTLLQEHLPAGVPAADTHARRHAAETLRQLLLTRSSLLVSSSDGRWARFIHRSFQEFLVARAMAGEPLAPETQVERLTEAQLGPWWRQTLVFLPSWHAIDRPKVARAFVEAVLTRAVRCTGAQQAEVYDLAGACLLELPQVRDTELLGAFVQPVSQEVVRTGWPLTARAALADRLGALGVTRVPESAFVPIPGGSFVMGAQSSDPEGPNFDRVAFSQEGPPQEKNLPAFALARFPVTVAQFAGFVDAGGYAERSPWREEGWAWRSERGVAGPGSWDDQREYLDRPVTQVSWYEACAFAAWLTARCQDGQTYALPNEAQWERAARGPTGGGPFPWGPDLTEGDGARANFDGAGPKHATSVGLFPTGTSPEGVEDLAGNVWEWCGDLFRRYGDGTPFTKKDFKFLADEDLLTARVVRGGSWHDPAGGCRVSCRSAGRPSGRFADVGFRLVRSGPA